MNRRIPIALTAALVISGGCTYLLGRKLQSDRRSSQQQMVRYVAPSHTLQAGELLQPGDLGWAAWPASDVLQGALLHADAVVGRVVLYPVETGQPILERDLAAPGNGGGLGSRIPRGMRALALRSDEVVGVAGFLAPGSRLDVLVTYHTAESAEAMTATVVQNAEVLAAGQQADPDPAGKPSIATVVTLLLTPLEAERAVAASTQGAIHFVLRNALDKEEVTSAPVSLSWLGAGPRPASGVLPLPLAFPGPSGTGVVRPFVYRQQNVGDGIETIFGERGGPVGQGGAAVQENNSAPAAPGGGSGTAAGLAAAVGALSGSLPMAEKGQP
jgi:pilus assembly protein CpaB